MDLFWQQTGCDPTAGVKKCLLSFGPEFAFLDNTLAVLSVACAILYAAFRALRWLFRQTFDIAGLQQGKKWCEGLPNPENWRDITMQIQRRIGADQNPGLPFERARSYQTGLTTLRRAADDFWGDRLFSVQAFNRCLTIAVIYPIFAALLTWVISGQVSLGGLTLVEEEQDLPRRLLGFLTLCAASGFLGWFFKNGDTFVDHIHARLTQLHIKLDQRGGFLAKAPRWSLGVIALVVVVGAFVVVGVFVVVFTVVVVGAFAGDIDAALLICFFFIALPILNAVMDLLSLAATRHFVRRILDHDRTWAHIALELLADLILALVCLFALVVMITFGLDLWTDWGGSRFPPPMDWRIYRAQILTDYSAGVMLALMCFTTFLPTAVHWAVAVWGMSLFHSTHLAHAVQRIDALDPVRFENLSPAEQRQTLFAIEAEIRAAFGKTRAVTTLCMLLLMAVFLAGLCGGALLLAHLGIPPFAA